MIPSSVHKLVSILTSRETQAELLDRIRANPKTSWSAGVCVALWGAAYSLNEAKYFLASGLFAGAGSAVAVVALLFAFDKPGDPPAAGSA